MTVQTEDFQRTEAIRLFTANGWRVINQSEQGVQFARRPPPDVFLIVAGILTLPFCIGLLLLFMAFAKKERVVFVTPEQMEKGPEVLKAIMAGKYPRLNFG